MYEEPMTAEAYRREHPGMVSAVECAVRRELEMFHANSNNSSNIQGSLDIGNISSNEPLVFGDAQNRISKCGDCLIRVPCKRESLRALRGIDWLPIHIPTSLLMVGGIIFASLTIAGNLNQKQ